MFVFGTDGDTLRAWPIHTIKSVTFNPKGSGQSGGKAELAIHLLDGSVAWLRGPEAEATWKRISAEGFGLSSKKS
jgi:hypothetical protein